MVQLFLQPVIPCIKIQGRNIAAFFRKKKLPAYIMIEWKLDGAGGYLLTGIGIVPAEAPGMENEKNRIRYFTFTSKYTGANAFDIAHIALVDKNGGVLDVTPFREAREMLSEKERKDPFVFSFFPEDDGDRYVRRLAEFGIAQDEWKNVIAKINDGEGGLEELFQKYKNPGQLLNDWIIKTAETVRSETEGALQDIKVQEKIMQAARLVEEIRRKRSELSGIEEKLSASKEQYRWPDTQPGILPEAVIRGNPAPCHLPCPWLLPGILLLFHQFINQFFRSFPG